jgi:hypothetical protein
VSATSPTTIPRESVLNDNTPEGLPPLADLTEALARGREPRRPWPVLHSVEVQAEDEPRWWESWPALWLSIVVLLGAVWFTMLAKC